jgi:hypothetical protein
MRVSKTKDGHIEIDVENGHGKLTVTQVDAVSLHSELGKALGRGVVYVFGGDVASQEVVVRPYTPEEEPKPPTAEKHMVLQSSLYNGDPSKNTAGATSFFGKKRKNAKG